MKDQHDRNVIYANINENSESISHDEEFDELVKMSETDVMKELGMPVHIKWEV